MRLLKDKWIILLHFDERYLFERFEVKRATVDIDVRQSIKLVYFGNYDTKEEAQIEAEDIASSYRQIGVMNESSY